MPGALFLGVSAAPRVEKLAQQASRGVLADPGIDFGAVMAGSLAEKARTMRDRTALGIGRTIVKPGDSRMRNCPGAHHTRL